MAKKTDLTIHQMEDLEKVTVTQYRKAFFHFLMKEYAMSNVSEKSLRVALDVAANSIQFETVLVISGKFHDKYLMIKKGELYTKDMQKISSRKEVEDYFEKDEIVLLAPIKKTKEDIKAKNIFLDDLNNNGYSFLERFISKNIGYDFELKKIMPHYSKSRYLVYTANKIIKTDKGEIITNIDQLKYHMQDNPNLKIVWQDLMKKEIKREKDKKKQNKIEKIKEIIDISNDFAKKYAKEFGYDTNMEFLLKMIEFQIRSKNIAEIHEIEQKKTKEQQIDDLLDKMNMLKKMENMLGEEIWIKKEKEEVQKSLQELM